MILIQLTMILRQKEKSNGIKNDIREINLPIDFTLEKNGGVKSVIYFDSNYYALLSRKSLGCNYASLINLREQLEVITTKCIP